MQKEDQEDSVSKELAKQLQSRKESLERDKIIIYVICHDDDSEKAAQTEFGKFKWARILRNSPSICFESQAFYEIMKLKSQWIAVDWVGTVQYRHYQRAVHGGTVDLDRFCQDIDKFTPSYDLVAFAGSFCQLPSMGHTGIIAPFHKALNLFGLEISEKEMQDCPMFFNNGWVTKPPLYIQFLNNICRLMDWMTDEKYNAEMYQLVHENAGYFREVIPESGEYYPWIPFMLERFAPLFFRGVSKIFVNCLPFLNRKLEFSADGSFTGDKNDSLRISPLLWEWFSSKVVESKSKLHVGKRQWIDSHTDTFLSLIHPCVVVCCPDSLLLSDKCSSAKYVFSANREVTDLRDKYPEKIFIYLM